MARPYAKKRGGGGGGGRGGWGAGNSNSGNNRGSFNGGGFRSNDVGGGGRGGRRFGISSAAGGGRQNSRNGGGHGGPGGGNNGSRGGKGAGDSGVSGDVMKTLLKLLFEKNPSFDEGSGMLMLTNMSAAPDLASTAKSVDFNSVGFCKSLCEVLRDCYGDRLRVLQVDNNDIRKLSILCSALVETDLHLNITALSAAGNSIAELSFLGPLRKFPMLNEVLLTNNPVTQSKDYRGQITRTLPNLMMLDGERIERYLLSMPNPIAPVTNDTVMSICEFISSNMLLPLMTQQVGQALEQQVAQVYANDCVFSLSCAAEPLPRNLPFSPAHNNGDLDKSMKSAMVTDFSGVRQNIHWRNLEKDIHSMREIGRGSKQMVKRMRDLVGAAKSTMRVQVLANPNVNVSLLEQGVKVPVALVTIHGRMRYMWNPNPTNSAGSAGIFQEGKEPFLSTFFDRTLTLIWQDNRYQVANDMTFCRPDKIVTHDDGTPSTELFFATNDGRVEQLRRKLLPAASHDVMKYIVNLSPSDRTTQQCAEVCLGQLSPEQLQSVDAVKECLNRAFQQ